MSRRSSSISPIPISNYDLDDFNWENLLDSPGAVAAGNAWNDDSFILNTPPGIQDMQDVGIGAAPVPSPRTSSRLSMMGGHDGTPMIATPLSSSTQIAGPSGTQTGRQRRGKSPAGTAGRLRAPNVSSSSASSLSGGSDSDGGNGRRRSRVRGGRRGRGGRGRRGGGGGRRGGGGGGRGRDCKVKWNAS